MEDKVVTYIKSIEEFDQSFALQLKGRKEIVVSYKVASSLLISE